MTYKNTKNPALVAVFALTLLVPGAALQSAYASDTDDVDILVNEMSATQNEISQLESDPVKNAEKIDALTDKFWAMNDVINAVTDVVPERDFLSEWEALEIRKQSLQDKLTNLNDLGTSGDLDIILTSQISQIDDEIEQLRQASIQSMVLDPKIENDLASIQYRIHSEFPHIENSGIDAEEKKVLVFVDYDDPSNTEKTLNMIKTLGVENVIVEDIGEPTSCSSTKKKCDPALGGLAILRPGESDPRGFSGSVGYKATDRNGHVGFVTAGHVADPSTRSSTASSNTVINFHDNSTLGTVTEAYGKKSPARSDGKKHVDVAFVKTNKIADDVFLRSNIQGDIVAYAGTTSAHVKGDFVYKIGAASGYQKLAKIVTTLQNGDMVYYKTTTYHHSIPGDSGGTVYKKDRNNNVTIMGHIKEINKYVTVNAVKNLYGITPMTR